MTNNEVDLLYYQHEFLASKAKEALLLGGIGSGKTFTGSHFCINMLDQAPRAKGLIVANTYTQLMNATVTSFITELENNRIRYRAILSGPKKRIIINGATRSPIYLYSLEKYDNIRGIEAGWCWGDESLFQSKVEAFKVVRGRLRDKNGPLFLRHTSSPNGFNWGYDKFENRDGINKTKSVHLIRAKTYENIFLPEGYYDDLLEDYGGADNPLARQELFGEFTNLQAGAIYWAFDRRIHVQPCKLNKEYPVYVGQDFNVNNMAACYIQKIGNVYYVTNENILTDYGANTDTAAQKICADLSGFTKYVIPDSTGKSIKSSSSGRSDIEILKSYGLNVMSTSNPFIRDRQNTVNVRFKQSRIVVSPECKELIKEMETLSSREKEGEKAHVSVSMGYVLSRLEPLTSHRQQVYSTQR